MMKSSKLSMAGAERLGDSLLARKRGRGERVRAGCITMIPDA